MGSAFYQTGGFFYIDKKTNQALVRHDLSDDAASKNEAALVPCRAMSKVRRNRHQSCVSIIDPERPGWYMIHRKGYVYFEPEYATRNRKRFDKDASFFISRSKLFPGFRMFESVSRPNHFTHTTADDMLALSLFQNTSDFHAAASLYPIRRNYKGELTVI